MFNCVSHTAPPKITGLILFLMVHNYRLLSAQESKNDFKKGVVGFPLPGVMAFKN